MSGSNGQPPLPPEVQAGEGDAIFRRTPVAPLGTDDLPIGWSLVLAREFEEVAPNTWGAAAAGPNGWAPVDGAFGASAAGFGTARWMRGGLLEAVPGALRIHTQYNAPSGDWLVDGVKQTAYGGAPHPGYGEFHIRFGFACSTLALRGIGPYVSMRPARGSWGSEWVLAEAPTGDGSVIASSVHADFTGRGDMAVWGDRFSQTRLTADLSFPHTIEGRRTFRSVAGQTVATFRYWLDGVEVTPDDRYWRDNPFAVEPWIFSATGFVAGPSARQYAAPDDTTPRDSWIEISYLQIWTPV
jgi:hypothetical protein